MLLAAGVLLTDPTFHNLSNSQFGFLTTPHVLLAIAASFLAAPLAQRIQMKGVLLLGLLANLVAMLLLALSHLTIGDQMAAFVRDIVGHTCRDRSSLWLHLSTLKEGFGLNGGSLHDPCTVAALIDPTLIHFEPMHVGGG